MDKRKKKRIDGYRIGFRGGIGGRPRWKTKTRKEEKHVVAEKVTKWLIPGEDQGFFLPQSNPIQR